MTHDPTAIITDLALRFPALKGAPGLDPWDPAIFDRWASSGIPGSGARAAARFVLAVWNGSADHWQSGPFFLRDLDCLDDENLEAWQDWAARPFFL